MALSAEYRNKIEYFLEIIPKRMYSPVEELAFEGFFTYDRLSLDEALICERQPLPEGLQWGKKWEYGWFFTKITIPEACRGHRVVLAAKQGESVVFVNGNILGAFDKEHSHITLTYNAEGGESFDIAMEVYAGHDTDYENIMIHKKVTLVLDDADLKELGEDIPLKTVAKGSFGIFYEEVFQLWMDIKTLYDLRNNLDDNSLRKAKTDKALMEMCDKVNIELSVDSFIAAANNGREILKPCLDCKNGSTAPVIYAIGHSHLDLQWLWTTAETRRKVARTLGNQLKLIEEYPEYKYIQSQPWILETLKNEYPDLYTKVKKAVKDGNIIVEGGMWVEADTNILSGESLIRQFVFGKRFIKDEFGTDSEIFWLPDSFGMTAALPQILKGCGIRYFMNAKIKWQYNGGDEVPYSNFWWRGIDGTEVLTNLTMEYASEMTPSKTFEKWELNKEKADVPIVLLMYGHGDGGGGATRIHLEHLKREADLEGMPRVISDSPNNFFKALEKDCEVNKTYVGELYYSAHRGTYTTQAKTKKLNRQGELALRDAELWSALLNIDSKAETDALWKTILFNQFHDIIPGSSISAVHKQSEKDFADVTEKASRISDNARKAAVDTDKTCITVFNSLSHQREEIIELPDGILGLEGCLSQKIGDKVYASVTVPSCGYKSFKAGKVAAEPLPADNSLVLENALIRAEFNEQGELVNVFDKTNNIACLSRPSNVFRMYQDMTSLFDAWDIDSFYEKQEIILDAATETYVEHKGPLSSCIVIKKKINNSYITQRVILRANSKKIDFETEVDWCETHKLLKVDFNTNIHTDELVSEIQFGHIRRPNHKTRPFDADRFEVCNYKWSALAETRRGVAVLNDCKYGISSDGGRMSLTLLRSAVNPDPSADKGVHFFTYALLPFSESLADSKVIDTAYELNCPLCIKQGFAGEKSFIKTSESNIIVDTVKLAEDGSGDPVIRLYESVNSFTSCRVDFGFDVKKAYITNMLEESSVETIVTDNGVSLDFKGFEVITIRLKRS